MATLGVTIPDPTSPAGIILLAAASTPLLLFLLGRALTTRLDPREPPAVYPTIPLIGHIVSLFREQGGFYQRVCRENPLPIMTLPMLRGKMYVITSPPLITAAMANRDISMDPFMLSFTKSAFGLSEHVMERISPPEKVEEAISVTHHGLMGEPLKKMIGSGQRRLMTRVNGLLRKGEVLAIPDLKIWVSNLTEDAVFGAMYGSKNPWTDKLVELLWKFDESFILLTLGIAPQILAKTGYAARETVRNAMRPFYMAQLDQGGDVSELIRGRAAMNRRRGIAEPEICSTELAMPWAAVTNTVPSTFWFFVELFSRPEYVARMREDLGAITAVTVEDGGRRVATIDMTRIEKACPFLFACYNETHRMYNHSVGQRQTMADTVLRDPTTGREYLLTAGTNVQWPIAVPGNDPAVWGPSPERFDPDRWMLSKTGDNKEILKKRRNAIFPFGGGKHLCPGKSFATTETMSMVALLSMGFDFDGVKVPAAGSVGMGQAVRPVKWGEMDKSVRIRRREGWEDVEWRLTVPDQA